MSNKDYRKYHQQPDTPQKPEFNTVEEVVADIIKDSTDETLDKMFTPEDSQIEKNHKTEKLTEVGVVTECTRLNVRKLPNQKAEVLIILDFATEVTVKEYNQNPDWVKVLTKTGVEGYCMKKFINTK